jgi:hypothetical protein
MKTVIPDRLYCKTSALLYNQKTFDVIVHQRKPLAPVALNLPVLGYLWGWRRVDFHDRSPTSGQVICREQRRQPKKMSGERQWFLNKPVAIYKPIKSVLTMYRRLCGRCYWRQAIACRLSYGYVRVLAPVITNKESQVLVVPGSHNYFMMFNCIFR